MQPQKRTALGSLCGVRSVAHGIVNLMTTAERAVFVEPAFAGHDSTVSSVTAAVLAVIPEWWAHRAAAVGLGGSWLDVRKAVSATPPSPLCVGLPYADTSLLISGHSLGQAYVESLSPRTRSEHGRHYTPEVLADRLWSMARAGLRWNSEDHQLHGLVRDPACGGGALLLAAIREHLRASYSTDPSITVSGLANHIQGIDQDPWAVYLANVVLAAEVLPTLARIPENLRRPVPVLAVVGDGLAPLHPAALVSIMNPPYGRLKLDDATRSRFSETLYGHANLYGLFMAAGAASLTEDGVLAALVPTSFSAGLYFHKLREYLAGQAPLRSMTFVQDRSGVFNGVIQETCLAVFARKRSRRVDVARSNGTITTVATVPSPRGSRPWLMPRESSDAALAAAASVLPLTLSACGWHASTGPLVWNRRKQDLHARSGVGRVRIIWAADIDGGTIHRDRTRDDKRYLAISLPSDSNVMVLGEPAVLVQRTTSPEQVRRLVAVDLSPSVLNELGGSVIIENHVNVLRPTLLVPLISRVTLARILATPTFDRLMRCISGSVAVSSYELASLPMPAPDVLASWENLQGDELGDAVAKAYRTVSTA